MNSLKVFQHGCSIMPGLALNKASYIMNSPTVNKYIMLDFGSCAGKKKTMTELRKRAPGIDTFCGGLSDY